MKKQAKHVGKSAKRRASEPFAVFTVAGQSIRSWTQEVGIGYSTYFVLPLDLRPRRARIGRRQLIIEPAREWLDRVEKAGGINTTRVAA